ncbi:MAG: chemotaxis protein CheW [Desulfobulbaceae bacterium]|nr:chemotaxis protein CheW [Desulfobulbaceae bacterium]
MRSERDGNPGQSACRYQFSTFYLAGRLFGVNILDVKEITPQTTVTPIFHARPEVKGYVNIRGQVHLVLNLRLLLGLDEREVDPQSRIILFKAEVGEDFGVLVDQVSDVLAVEEDMIDERRQELQEMSEQSERRIAHLGKGVCKLDTDLMVILESRRFLKAVKV